jgi:hypothetical protein
MHKLTATRQRLIRLSACIRSIRQLKMSRLVSWKLNTMFHSYLTLELLSGALIGIQAYFLQPTRSGSNWYMCIYIYRERERDRERERERYEYNVRHYYEIPDRYHKSFRLKTGTHIFVFHDIKPVLIGNRTGETISIVRSVAVLYFFFGI